MVLCCAFNLRHALLRIGTFTESGHKLVRCTMHMEARMKIEDSALGKCQISWTDCFLGEYHWAGSVREVRAVVVDRLKRKKKKKKKL